MTTLPIASTPVLSACCQDGADGTGQLSHKTLRTLRNTGRGQPRMLEPNPRAPRLSRPRRSGRQRIGSLAEGLMVPFPGSKNLAVQPHTLSEPARLRPREARGLRLDELNRPLEVVEAR